MEFRISRFSLFYRKKSIDNSVFSKDVRYIFTFISFLCCNTSQFSQWEKNIENYIKKSRNEGWKAWRIEEREFTKCIIQSGYSDTYQDFDSDCKKSGKAAEKIELTTWKVS